MVTSKGKHQYLTNKLCDKEETLAHLLVYIILKYAKTQKQDY